MRTPQLALLAAIAALTFAPAAGAAEPASATLSRTTTGADWSGEIKLGISYTTFFAGAGQCAPDGSCDTFRFTVADAGAELLVIRVAPTPDTDAGAFEVVHPDGTRDYAPPTAPGATTRTIKAPAGGEYVVNVVNNTGLGDTYKGSVRLKFPAPPDPPAAAPVPAAPAPVNPPAPAPAAGKPSSTPSSRVAACRKKARKIKSAKRRKAALKRCKPR
jgi:hypothetical protein